MEEDWTSKAIITPIVKYEYVRIDIHNKMAALDGSLASKYKILNKKYL
jgi:hypothetical protein